MTDQTPETPESVRARMHVLLAEALRCLDDGRLDVVRRKIKYADAELQDAATLRPLSLVYPMPLNAGQLKLATEWAADDRLWTTQDTVERNLQTFARCVLREAAALLRPQTVEEKTDANREDVRQLRSGDQPAAGEVSVVQPFRWRAVGSAIQTAPNALTATGDEVRAVTLASKHNEVVAALLRPTPAYLSADDYEQIADGLEYFVMNGDPAVDEIWQPYVDKLKAASAALPPPAGEKETDNGSGRVRERVCGVSNLRPADHVSDAESREVAPPAGETPPEDRPRRPTRGASA